MKQKIIKELSGIEKKHGVKILLASESGSRAWGFPSNDSDYDVRFIYVHPRDWYLTIDEKRDVIELPIDNTLDISGWDLRKSLRLMRKSNSPLLEWISSPIQYQVWNPGVERLQRLSELAFLPETSCHHYLSMAKKSIEKIERSEKAVVKTYMYAIRPVLCCKWIINYLTHPPMHIKELLTEIRGETHFKNEVVTLIEKKKAQSEGFLVSRSEVIETYLNRQIQEIQSLMPKNPQRPNSEIFDCEFRDLLSELNR